MSRKILNRNTTVSSKGFGTDGLDSLLLKLFTVWNFEPGHFNEDATGQGHNANGVGSRPYLSEQDFGAIQGSACAIGSSGQNQSIGTGGSYVPGDTDDFSLALWIKPPSQPSSGQEIRFFVFRAAYHDTDIMVKYSNSGGIYTFAGNVLGDVASTSSYAFNLNSWNLLGMSVKTGGGGFIKVYLNGYQIATVAHTNNGSIGAENMNLIGEASTYSNWLFDSHLYFRGLALSSQNMLDLWNNGNGRFYESRTIVHNKVLFSSGQILTKNN